MNQDPNSQFEETIQRLFSRLERWHMPFGKYGPDNFPPDGAPIVDLPYEYLAWFKRKGFPKGQLGELLEFVHQMKLDGADAAFDPIRRRNGGRTNLRKPPKKNWDFH